MFILNSLTILMGFLHCSFLLYKRNHQGCEDLQVYLPNRWVECNNVMIPPSIESIFELIADDKDSYNRLYLRGAW